MKKGILLLLVLTVICRSGFGGDAPIRLYKEFLSEMSYEEVKRKPNMQVAHDFEDIRLYREDEKFGGQTWEQRFHFQENSLTAVSLHSYNTENYMPAVLTIANSGFSLLYMESATQSLDCLELIQTQQQSTVLKAVEEFEQEGLSSNFLMLMYVDTPAFQKMMLLTGEETLSQLLAALSGDTRVVSVKASALENPDEPTLLVTFSTLVNLVRSLKEDF